MQFFAPVSQLFDKKAAKRDAIAGVTLGVESIPDGMGDGVLAGLANPVGGVYGYMFGGIFGAFFTGSTLMSIQGTSAMALIISEQSPVTKAGDNPAGALVTLGLMTGAVMVILGLLNMGSALRFVPDFVMHSFSQTVGLSIIMGQLGDFTGVELKGDNKPEKTLYLFQHLGEVNAQTLAIGAFTIALLYGLGRTQLKAWGTLVAIAIGSALPILFGWKVVTVNDVATIPRSLPLPMMPDLSVVGSFIGPAVALAMVGLIQGAVISRQYPNPDGSKTDPSVDFYGQGMANIFSGVLRGCPVGGSFSATSILSQQGAQSRFANLVAGVTIGAVLLIFQPIIALIAMPAIAGFLITIGFGVLNPPSVVSTWHVGWVYRIGLVVMMGVGLFVDLQTAVIVGSVITMVYFVVTQSNNVNVREMIVDVPGVVGEHVLGDFLDSNQVVVVRHYGTLFYASAQKYVESLPQPNDQTTNSAVVAYMRGVKEFDSSVRDSLVEYAENLRAHQSRLFLADVDPDTIEKFRRTPEFESIGEDHVFLEQPEFLEGTRRAIERATRFVQAGQHVGAEANVGTAPPVTPHADTTAVTDEDDGSHPDDGDHHSE